MQVRVKKWKKPVEKYGGPKKKVQAEKVNIKKKAQEKREQDQLAAASANKKLSQLKKRDLNEFPDVNSDSNQIEDTKERGAKKDQKPKGSKFLQNLREFSTKRKRDDEEPTNNSNNTTNANQNSFAPLNSIVNGKAKGNTNNNNTNNNKANNTSKNNNNKSSDKDEDVSAFNFKKWDELSDDGDDKDAQEEAQQVFGDDDKDDEGEDDDDIISHDSVDQDEERPPLLGDIRSEVQFEGDDEMDSDEEEVKVRTGPGIPQEWYRDYNHVGYDIHGKKVIRSVKIPDAIDTFLDANDKVRRWTIYDPLNDVEHVITPEEKQLLRNIRDNKFPDAGFNPYEVINELPPPDIHPTTNILPPKASFLPPKWETGKVNRLARRILAGWILAERKGEKIDLKTVFKKKDENKAPFWDVWSDQKVEKEENPDAEQEEKMHHQYLPAPKVVLPGHAESFNPPQEYLFTVEEERRWAYSDVADRKLPFIPKKYPNMRSVPSYRPILQETFRRCLDLHLAPRKTIMRSVYDNVQDLYPELPTPSELRPFPSREILRFVGHTDVVRSISLSPLGDWLVSASEDKMVRFWETRTGRCHSVLTLPCPGETYPSLVAWNPNPLRPIVAVVVGSFCYMVVAPVFGEELTQSCRDLLALRSDRGETADDEEEKDEEKDKEKEKPVKNSFKFWVKPTELTTPREISLIPLKVQLRHEIKYFTWHRKGDYFATNIDNPTHNLHIHQLEKQVSQNPFGSKNSGVIEHLKFHPTKPFLFITTRNRIRVYNLVKGELVKKLVSMLEHISSIDVHPGGDNFICSSYDGKFSWFDLDLSTKAWKTYKPGPKESAAGLRKAAYHTRYPLFAVCSDDGSTYIFHGMVYSDLLKNTLIVPLKALKGHTVEDAYGVMDIAWHPEQPWIVTAGADNTIRLWA